MAPLQVLCIPRLSRGTLCGETPEYLNPNPNPDPWEDLESRSPLKRPRIFPVVV